MFQKLAIVGVGLIGGSFGQWARKNRVAREVVGVARRPETLVEAVANECVDWATADLIHACQGADLVFLSPPVGVMRTICEQIAPVVKEGALITDAGSTKDFVADCEAIFAGKAHFIGGHPMAGSEATGPSAARTDLFEGAAWILTPTEKTNDLALQKLELLLQKTGAYLLKIAPARHDQLLAVTSHLPHVSASALVHCYLGAQKEGEPLEKLVAGGWRDSTRVAAGSAEMWRDIALANRNALLDSVKNMENELAVFRALLEKRDAPALQSWFEVAASKRREF